jgi:hypothetical protein
VELIVVVNAPANCSEEACRCNQATLKAAADWIGQHSDRRLAVHLLDFRDLPEKHAGVGLARKIGMDEALRRLDDVGRLRGIIAGFDADCRCETNYLTSIEGPFQQNPGSPGCSIYFEHPLDGGLQPEIYQAAAAYELHLRYYVQALRFSGFPHAHHTIGSCLAVRADAYCKQGGMNRRKAGEDFYFLHKIIALGGFTELNATTVYPSPRPSDRVPFGTGKAVRAFLERREITTYPFEAFLDLKLLFDRLPLIFQCGEELADEHNGRLPASLLTFLNEQRFAEVASEIRQNTASEAACRKRFFHWFDGFRAMKFVHHACAAYYGKRPVEKEAARLLAKVRAANDSDAGCTLRELLQTYRVLARGWPSRTQAAIGDSRKEHQD